MDILEPAFEHHVTNYKFVIYNFKSTNMCGEHAIIVMDIRVVPIDTNFQIKFISQEVLNTLIEQTLQYNSQVFQYISSTKKAIG